MHYHNHFRQVMSPLIKITIDNTEGVTLICKNLFCILPSKSLNMSHKSSPLQPQWQSQAWKQFLAARSEMLNAYDSSRSKSAKKAVQVEHGRVAEAQFRRWLTTFLPKKYGVTSGYIISQGTSKDEYLVHYDVIIYEQLEAPILWVDDSPDYSDQGKSLAIPVEYVRGVIEVKASFNSSSATDAVKQLAKLKPLMQKTDLPNHPIKMYLPKEFFCATVFFELRKEHERDFAAMDKLLEATMLRGFYGGFILRTEMLDEFFSGKITILLEDADRDYTNNALSFWAYSKSRKLREDLYCKLMLNHCESYFSQFAFDIIALLKGTYRPGVISSLYGFGTSYMEEGKSHSIQYYNIEDKKKWDEMSNKHFEYKANPIPEK